MEVLKSIIKANAGWLRPLFERMQIASLKSAMREQDLNHLSLLLEKAVPDLTDQYSTFKIDSEYLQVKVRSQHAFQIKLALNAIEIFNSKSIPEDRDLYVVDIGDSSGSHVLYLKYLIEHDPCFKNKYNFLSVNVDPIAVSKIQKKGMKAILCKAEALFDEHNIKADLFLSYEMIEHLYDPIGFLGNMSKNIDHNSYFVLTVPYLEQSRVGLHHIRGKQYRVVYPENTHIFELSPTDWKLIFNHAGWEVIDEFIYRQYPLKSWLKLMKPFWKKCDFEGFYGVILKGNRSWADCYKSSI